MFIDKLFLLKATDKFCNFRPTTKDELCVRNKGKFASEFVETITFAYCNVIFLGVINLRHICLRELLKDS